MPSHHPHTYRPYNFASTSYKSCFGGLPIADGVKLRADTVAYLDAFDPQAWYDAPVTSLLNGTPLVAGTTETTVDAFNAENGKITMATAGERDAIIEHMQTFVPSKRDFRKEVRALEAELLEVHSARLIGNQAMDFLKQDGVTEIEESIQ